MKQSKTINMIVVCLAILGFVAFFTVNLPTTSEMNDPEQLEPLTYKVSKAEAAKHAEDFIDETYSLTAAETFVMMQSEAKLQGYLQKYKLLDQLTTQLEQSNPLEYYLVEIKTEQGSTYLVRIHPETSEVVGWTKIGRTLTATPNGEQIARNYLQAHGFDVEHWDTVPNDAAGEYVFATSDISIDGVELHLHIGIESEQIVTVLPQFIVPKEYERWLSGQDASAAMMSLLYLVCNLFMGIAAIVICVIYRPYVSFARGTLLTTIFFIIYSMNNINMYPAYRAMVAGESESALASVFTILFSQLFAFMLAATVYLTLVAGDGIWRKLGRPLWTRWSEADYRGHILRSVGYGYLFCLFLLGLQQVLFWAGERYFDVWSVNDPMFSEVNQLWPLAAPLLAWAAAISEEALFRLFGIGLFKRWFKSSALAAILSSMIWAIGHTSYPIYPTYTRFVEVAIIGLVFSFIFLKFGFITAVFTHASFNSILMGVSLIFTVSGAQALLGLVYIASPAIVGFILYWLHSIFRKRPTPPHLDAPTHA